MQLPYVPQVAARLGQGMAATWADRFDLEHRRAVDAGLTAVDGINEALESDLQEQAGLRR